MSRVGKAGIIPGMSLQRVRVVLVNPQGPLNVGAVARAMKNMGAEELVLVNPLYPPTHPHAVAMASGARDLLERAEVVPSLEEALRPCSFTVGTTRRKGKRRQGILTPKEIAPEVLRVARDYRVALIFGPEDRGLSNEELDLCQEIVTIPAHPRYGSLNLAQAVMILLYELFLAAHPTHRESRKLATSEELEGMYRHMEEVLLRIGFLDPNNPKRMMTALRRLFGRARLDSREVRIIRGIMRQVNWVAEQMGKKKEVEGWKDSPKG